MNHLVNWLQQSRSLKSRFLFLVLVTYWMLIFTGTHLPRLPKGMPRISDKWLHASAFFGLAFLLAWLLRRSLQTPRLTAGCTIACCMAYGIFDETTQMLVKNRHPDVADYFADCLGACAGLLTFLAMRKLRDSLTPDPLVERSLAAEKQAA
jgi:VanZ family protein